MRQQILPVAVAALALAVTGCGAQVETAGEQLEASHCNAQLGAGVVSDQIKVSDKFGAKPGKIELPKDVGFSHSEATLVNDDKEVSGSVDRAKRGDLLTVDLTVIDGSSGKTVYQSKGYSKKGGSDFIPVPSEKPSADSPTNLGGALECAAPGERYAIAFSPEDAMPLAESFGTTPGSPVVAVADVHDVSNVQDRGTSHALPNGFPAVTVDENGTPGVVMPPSDPPKKTRVAERYSGNGSIITKDDSIAVQVSSVSWDGSQPQGDTWSQGPQLLGPEGDKAPAWRKQLTGMHTGSLAVIIEPAQGGGTATVNVLKVLTAG
jgi:hypothetical protein